jgi:predicted lipoprotein with Yx(FWY)xxD motif
MQTVRVKAIARCFISAIAVLGVTAAAAAGARLQPHAARHTVVSLEKTKFGSILVANGDEVLYLFTKGNSVSTCTAACASVWPPFKPSHLVAGPGVNAKQFHTVRRGSSRQVTYNGHLLYLYADGRASYDVAYIGISQFGGRWKAITATGASVG